MATTYWWIISAMDTIPSEDGLTDVVQTVHWRRNASLEQDGKTYTGDVYGSMWCIPPDPMSFVPYADLTFDQVCSWLETNLDVASLDAALDQQIANAINPPIVQLPLPWAPQPQPIVEQQPSAEVVEQPVSEEPTTEQPVSEEQSGL